MIDKFGSGLSLNKSDTILSPRIDEFYLHFECRLLSTIEVGLYDCFAGLVLSMSCTHNLFSNKFHHRGAIDYNHVKPIFCLADEYWDTGDKKGISTENKNHPHGDRH